MFNYAITINKNHNILTFHGLDLDDSLVLEFLKNMLIDQFEYVNLVGHHNNVDVTSIDHIHGLVTSDKPLNYLIGLNLFHVEVVRNPQAYIKYMYSHTLHSSIEPIGSLAYQENDDMITYVIVHGLVKTVEKYGMVALRNYKNLKEFYTDYNVLLNKKNHNKGDI